MEHGTTGIFLTMHIHMNKEDIINGPVLKLIEFTRLYQIVLFNKLQAYGNSNFFMVRDSKSPPPKLSENYRKCIKKLFFKLVIYYLPDLQLYVYKKINEFKNILLRSFIYLLFDTIKSDLWYRIEFGN